MQRPLILVFLLTLFHCCAAQNDTLPQCALLCAGTAATAAGCSSYYNASCVCASQSFQAAIQGCFGGNCATTDQGTAWVYYSTLCTNNDSVSTGVSLTTSVTHTTSSTPASTTATHTTSGTITQTSSAMSTTTSTNSSSTTTSSETPGATSRSEAVAVIDVHILHGIIGVIAAVGVLML